MKRVFRLSRGRAGTDRDVSDEFRFHLDMRTQEFIEQGLSADDARRAAADAFGDMKSFASEVRTMRTQLERRTTRRDWMNGLVLDAKFALRTFVRNPGFTLAALLTLTLGIGATTAVFTVVNGVLLRPLPYRDPGKLALVWLSGSEKQGMGNQLPLSSGMYLELAAHQHAFDALAAFRAWPYTVSGDGAAHGDGPAEQVSGARVSPSLFGVLGVRPHLGQAFSTRDAAPNAPHVAIISYSYWQRQFAGSPTIVGQRIRLSGEPFTVVGVMPPGFSFPRGAELPVALQFGAHTDIWTPLVFTPDDAQNYGTLNLASVARLKGAVTTSRASLDLSSWLKGWLKENNVKIDMGYRVVGLQEEAGGSVRRSLLVLMGAVAFVMLIACANVTNLLVGRTAFRQREFAVRAALGAGRARIARQLVTENVLLAATGTALGLLVSLWGVRVMLAMVPGTMPRIDDVSVDWRVIVMALAVALGAGTVFGVVTAYQVKWPGLAGTLQSATNRATGGVRRRLGRRLLVVAEVSLSLMLLIGATQLTLSFLRLEQVKPGFDASGALVADVQMPLANGFDPVRDGPRWQAFFVQLMERLNAMPAVVAAGAVSSMPLTGADESSGVTIVGRPVSPSGLGLKTQYNVTSGRYFEAMGIPLLRGRTFDSRDNATGAPAIIVNREFVHRYLADSNALGVELNASFVFVPGAPHTIVGVVDNVLQTALDGTPEPQVYVTEAQMPYPSLSVVVRTRGEPASVTVPLRQAVRSLDGAAAVAHVRPLEEVLAASIARQRFSATIIIAFAGAALALAMVGLYGVIALLVNQRRREIGVRMALGAGTRDVLRLLLGEGIRITAVALVLGAAGAVALHRVLDAMLFGLQGSEAMVFVVATVIVGSVSLLATYVPARRATLVDPTATLRAD